jgi:hypothetical protein
VFIQVVEINGDARASGGASLEPEMLPVKLLRGKAMERLPPSERWAFFLRRRAGGEKLERIRRGRGRPRNSRERTPSFPASRIESGSGKSTDRKGASRFRRDGPQTRALTSARRCLLFWEWNSRAGNRPFTRQQQIWWFSGASHCANARNLSWWQSERAICSLFAMRFACLIVERCVHPPKGRLMKKIRVRGS